MAEYNLSNEQIDYALRLAGSDWRVLKHLINHYNLSGQQLKHIVDLVDDDWEWLETMPGIRHFFKKYIDSITASVDINNSGELYNFIYSVKDVKLSKQAADEIVRMTNDDSKKLVTRRLANGIILSRPHTTKVSGIDDNSLQANFSHLREQLLNLLLKHQKLPAEQIDKLRHIFTDTPMIFATMLEEQRDRLSLLQIKRIIRITARKRAAFDYLAKSNEGFYQEQVELFLGEPV